MTVTTDAVVIGGGVIGASCAVALARAGLRVVVLDRARGPAAGSTGRATGGFRAQFATAIDIRLSLFARDRLLRFRDDTGVDPGFERVGYLWLASTPAELAVLARAHALQLAEGLHEAVLVDVEAIARINAHVALAGIAGGAWCPTDGVLRPTEILRGYLELAARLGVAIHWDAPVTALRRTGDRITEVVTPRAEYAAAVVVNAAGPWAAQVAALAGVELAVVPLRRQVAITEPSALPAALPLTIWLADGFHVRVRDGRALLLRPTPGNPDDPFDDRVEPAWLDAIAETAAARIRTPVVLDRARAWAGLYEMSPDHHAILGFAPGCPNLLLVNGSSGHGVMHAPALGELAAGLATAGPPLDIDIDIWPLRPDRFAGGEQIVGPSLL